MNTITNLALSNIKKDKSRSTLIILSILLTTLLLTVIATFCYGIINMYHTNAGKWFGTYYGTYNGVREENIAQMKLRSEFTDIGRSAVLGLVESEEDIYLMRADDMMMSMTNMDTKLVEGTYSLKGNEIAAQPGFFKQLGLDNPRLGDMVTISYRLGLSTPFAPDTFVISGLMEEKNTDTESKSFSAYVSEEYYEHTVSAEDRTYKVYFRMDEALGVNTENGKEIMKELAVTCGIDERTASDNYMYLRWGFDPQLEVIMAGILIAIVVILFSVMVIYNIFHVGIVQKIQEYGKLKAIGAANQQMKRIVFREGMLLAVIGIPLGIFAGYFVTFFSFGWLIKISDNLVNALDISDVTLFSPPVLLLAAALSFLTVWIAMKKPMKIVSSISPVEAMRYQESTGRKKGLRKGKETLHVGSMTMANLSAHRKRTVSTILTMGLSCVLFVTIASFVGSLDAQYEARRDVEHGQFEISLNYSLNDTVYPENNLDSILKENPLDEEFLARINEIDGVTEVRTGNILFAERIDENGQKTGEKLSMAVLDKEDFENELELGGILGNFDYEQVSAENGIIFGWSSYIEDYGFQLGKAEDMLLFSGTQQTTWSAEVLGSFGGTDGNLVITEDTYKNLGLSGNMTNVIWVDCNEADRGNVEEELREALLGTLHVEMTTYEDVLAAAKAAIQMLMVGGYLLCFLICFISFMNMANTIITSIITRKQEFGVLQAIGMTNVQLNQSLQMEGIFFTTGTVLVSLIIGIPIGYGVFCYGESEALFGLHAYRFPLMEIGIMVLALAVLQIVLSFILSKNVKGESLVERIRYQQ